MPPDNLMLTTIFFGTATARLLDLPNAPLSCIRWAGTMLMLGPRSIAQATTYLLLGARPSPATLRILLSTRLL